MPTVPTDLAGLSALYQTKVTIFTSGGAGQERILKADPRRWYVSFDPHVLLGSGSYVIPGPPIQGLAPSNQIGLPSEKKFLDCPSIVTGEWYGNFSGGGSIVITECLYIGT